MRVRVTIEREYEMDEARVLAEQSFEPPPSDADRLEVRTWLRETFWELCGERDRDHIDGSYVWLINEDGDTDFYWPAFLAAERRTET